jgi:NitT/TauT family transport system permease protein
MKQRFSTALNAAVVLAGLLLLWQAIIYVFRVPAFMLPGPVAVLRVVAERAPSLAQSFLITAVAAAGGLAASIVIGTAIALIFAQSRWLRRMFLPYTILLQTVPIVAIAPLILMWVGPGTFAVTVITFIICLAPVIANTTQGLISVDENMINLFLMQDASSAQILLFTGIRIASGIAVIGAIIGELFAGSVSVGRGGLGYSITYAQSQLQTDYLFALVFAATILGFLFFFTAMFAEYYFLHTWHESAQRTER